MITAIPLLALALAPSPAPSTSGDVVIDAMTDELARLPELRLSDTPAPYWASISVHDVEGILVQAKFGALVDTTTTKSRSLSPRLRVGDMELDAVGVPMFEEPLVTIEDDYAALRHALWRYTDGAYKMAASRYRHELTERTQSAVDPEQPDAFTPAPKLVSKTPMNAVAIDRGALESLARHVSAVFREHAHIRDAEVTIAASTARRRFASTDGSVVDSGRQFVVVTIEAETQADDGDILTRQIVHVLRPDALPSAEALEAEAAGLVADLAALRKAPLLRDYSGPVLFEADVAGGLFAGVLATELVASGSWRGDADAKLGQLVLPRGFDVVDDPLVARFGEHALLGQMTVDDEGTRAERVQLVKDGKLVGLLSARAPGKKVKQSNGHGFSAPYGMDVRPGITNLLVTAKGGLPDAALQKKLMGLVRERGAEFGLVVTAGGGGFGEGVTAYRVGKDGKRELVRVGHLQGLEFRHLRDIAAVGKVTAVRHAMQTGGMPMPAGAVPPTMAGFVSPISIVAPAVLLRDAELHAFTGGNPKPPAYPRPTFRNTKTPARAP